MPETEIGLFETHFAHIKDFPHLKTYYWSQYKVKVKQATAPPSFITSLSLWVCGFAIYHHSCMEMAVILLPQTFIHLTYNMLNTANFVL